MDQHTGGACVVAAITPEWLSPKQAAAYSGLSHTTLEQMRARGTGPEYTRIGRRIVRYKRSALDQYLLERSVKTTNPPTSFESDGLGATVPGCLPEIESSPILGPATSGRRVKNGGAR